MSSGEWDGIGLDIEKRMCVIRKTAEAHKKLLQECGSEATCDDLCELALRRASADVFVEKAQKTLTSRARWFIFGGIICGLFAVVDMIWFGYDVFEKINVSLPNASSGELVIYAMKGLTTSAFFGAVAVFLASMSKTLFHEATVLFNRRHALRFGRLVMYVAKGGLSAKEMQEAFKWSDEFSTAFKDIQTNELTKGILPKIIDGMMDALKKAIEAKK